LPAYRAHLQVESGEDVAGVTTDEQREAFLAQLTEMEDWLYGEGEAVDTAEYRWVGRSFRLGGREEWLSACMPRSLHATRKQ
jgi:hypothetical protein